MKDNDAILSADERYRYVLSRRVPYKYAVSPSPYANGGVIDARIVLWVCVNPSTANATTDDHTIRKVIGFCQRWGFARFRVVNLWAYRSTDISFLSAISGEVGVLNQPPHDIIGPDNDRHISEQVAFASEIIVAWGNRSKMPPSAKVRIARVLGLVRGASTTDAADGVDRPGPQRTPIFCLGRTKSGDPKHPLTLAYNTPRVRFED